MTLGVKHKVLDQGHVALVEVMGSDQVIDDCARASFTGGETRLLRSPSEIRRLNRYLVRHKHTTPFEHCRMRFHVKVPIFIWRQWIRHRMSSTSEKSGRYVEMGDWYKPKAGEMRKQHESSKQGSTEGTVEYPNTAVDAYGSSCRGSFDHYQMLMESGVSKEQARGVLPLAAYTEAYWSIDLHNIMHFLQLRLHPKAQYQFREYAQAIAKLVEEAFPISWESFKDFRLHSETFSAKELDFLLTYGDFSKLQHEVVRSFEGGKGERDELVAKIGRLADSETMKAHRAQLLPDNV